jgi:hypothetical protein
LGRGLLIQPLHRMRVHGVRVTARRAEIELQCVCLCVCVCVCVCVRKGLMPVSLNACMRVFVCVCTWFCFPLTMVVGDRRTAICSGPTAAATASHTYCHNVFTLLLHCCYTVVTMLSHFCYTCGTLLLQCPGPTTLATASHTCCHTVVTLLLHCPGPITPATASHTSNSRRQRFSTLPPYWSVRLFTPGCCGIV